MVGSRRRVVSSLLGATILLGSFGAGAAFAAGPPAGPADDAGTQAMTTQATVDRAKDLSDQAAAKAATSAAAAAADPGNVDKAAAAAADAAAAAVALEEFGKETKSLAGVNGGIASDAGKTPLADVHFSANNPVKSDNLQWIANSRGLPASNSSNANYAGATFMHFENLGYDFMLGDGTGGLSIFSLKNPENPTFVGAVPASALMQPADAHGTADTAARFYEGENPTVDSRRKLAFLARDPRSFGNSGHPRGRTGLYIIDVKDPWNPQLVTYHWVPAGHTATCINDCRYLWSVGPANNGSQVSGQPQDIAGVLHPEWTGVPAFVTDVRDINHPYTYAKPVDTKRNNGTTAYTHSVDVDQDGLAWTSGFGGIRGYYTTGMHTDPTTGEARYASATDPVPYAGGSVPTLETDAQYGTVSIEHNSYHVTQAASDKSPKTITTAAGRTLNKTDLQYVTQENVTSCTSTSGGGAGRFVTSNLAGSYDGKAWSPDRSASNRYFIEKLDDYTPKDLPGSVNGSSCSAHWFSVVGRHGGHRLLRPGHAHPRRVRSDRHPAGGLLPRAVDPGVGLHARPAGQQHVGRLLAQRLHLHRGLHPRHRRAALHGPDQGRRAAARLLELLRQVADRPEGQGRGHRRRRRHGVRHAGSDDRYAGRLRRVHAGPRQGLPRLDDGQRHLHGRCGHAQRVRPVRDGDRSPGQRHVLAAVGPAGEGDECGRCRRRVRRRRWLGHADLASDLFGSDEQRWR